MENKKNEINKDQKQEIKKDIDKVSGGSDVRGLIHAYNTLDQLAQDEVYVLRDGQLGSNKPARDDCNIPAGNTAQKLGEVKANDDSYRRARTTVGRDLSDSVQARLKKT